jgi:L-lactate dehydrogenase complex protein LldG
MHVRAENVREAFLNRVRQAVLAGNRAGAAPALPDRAGVGYQGAGPDAVARFSAELTAAGGVPHVASDDAAAWRVVSDVVRTHNARKVVLGRAPLLDRLDLAGKLRAAGVEVFTVDAIPASASRDCFFGADVGISGVHRLIAETGSAVMASRPSEPRSLSLLPPVHIALAEPSQILPDLFDLFDL